MRKGFIMGIFCTIVLLMAETALAGGVPESIVPEPAADVIFGTITRVEGYETTIQFARSMFGVVTEEESTLAEVPFHYLRKSDNKSLKRKGKVGEYCALGVRPGEDGKVKELYYNLASIADGLDAATVTLTSYGDLIRRMNVYLSTGTYSPERRRERIAIRETAAAPIAESAVQPASASVRPADIPVPSATPTPALAPEPAAARVILKRNYFAGVAAFAALFAACVGIYIWRVLKRREKD